MSQKHLELLEFSPSQAAPGFRGLRPPGELPNDAAAGLAPRRGEFLVEGHGEGQPAASWHIHRLSGIFVVGYFLDCYEK